MKKMKLQQTAKICENNACIEKLFRCMYLSRDLEHGIHPFQVTVAEQKIICLPS